MKSTNSTKLKLMRTGLLFGAIVLAVGGAVADDAKPSKPTKSTPAKPTKTSKKPSEQEQLFERVRSAHAKLYPEYFSAEVRSDILDAQLKLIPKESIVFGKKPVVQLLFKRGRALRLKVLNVEPYYKDLFSVYEAMLGQTGVFFGLDQFSSYKSFSATYNLRWNPKSRSIKVWERDGLEGDYGVFTLAKKAYTVEQSSYFEEGEKVADLRLTRVKRERKGKAFSLVKRLTMRLLGDDEPVRFVVALTNFNLDPIPKKAFE